jgi:hypothetical protein
VGGEAGEHRQHQAAGGGGQNNERSC